MEAHPRLQQAAYGQERQLPELASGSRPPLKSLRCPRFQGDPHVDVAISRQLRGISLVSVTFAQSEAKSHLRWCSRNFEEAQGELDTPFAIEQKAEALIGRAVGEYEQVTLAVAKHPDAGVSSQANHLFNAAEQFGQRAGHLLHLLTEPDRCQAAEGSAEALAEVLPKGCRLCKRRHWGIIRASHHPL